MQNPKVTNSNSLSPSRLLRIFDKVTGIFVDLFDARLLLPAVTALLFYAVLFTQRKFPGRWMEYIALGLVLVCVVALTARTPGFVYRVRWHRGMAALWFALHLWMLLSGFFFEDWLPEATALLIAYPFLFAVISARDDTSTFSAITKGTVFATMPFLLWSFIAKPIHFDFEIGYAGVFYNQNCLAMSAGLMGVCALLLSYAEWQQGRRKHAVAYGVISIIGAFAILISASRSTSVAYLGVVLVLAGCILLRKARRPWLVIVAMLCVILVVVSVLGWITWQKAYHTAEENYQASLHVNATTTEGLDPTAPPPSEKQFSMDDFSSMRVSLWRYALHNVTWNGHPHAYIEEWMQKFGYLHQRNAHNTFVQVAYDNGWPAGVLFAMYVLFSAYRAWMYYWRRRRTQIMAIAPLLLTTLFILQGMFESIYSIFSPVTCAYLLMQGVLWRSSLEPEPPSASPEKNA